MTLRASLALGGALLGASLAIALPGRADPPIGDPATVYVTVHETRTVDRRIEGWNVTAWRAHAVHNRRALNRAAVNTRISRARIRGLERASRRRWQPTVRLAIQYAQAVYGVDQTRRVACESHGDPYAHNGSGATGILQFLPSTWATTPFAGFSIYDPVAQALAGGWMVARAGRSGE